jgi:signal transduction histidine kinase
MTAIHPEDRERMKLTRVESLRTGETADLEYRVVRPDGEVRHIHSRSQIDYDETGRAIRVFGTNLDITDRKVAEEQLGRRARQQAAVAQVGLRALGADTLEELFDETVTLAAKAFELEFCILLESVPDAEELVIRAVAGPWAEPVRGRGKVSGAAGQMCWYVMQAMEPVVVADMATETRFAPCALLLDHGIVSGVSVPIHGRGRPFGVLGIHANAPRKFDRDDLNLLTSIANALAVTIARQRVEGELREKREELQALSHKLLETQEAERRALARELHDELGQLLTAIRLNLDATDRSSGRPLEESIGLVDEAIDKVRNLAFDLRPSILDDLGLVAALRWLIHRQPRAAGLEIALNAPDLGVALPPAVATCCFRVAQEALTNATRHARAQRAEIELKTSASATEIIVRDDGVGFDVAAARERAARGASLGLLSMEERVGLLGAKLVIESAAGRGTTVRARFPSSRGDVS